MYFLSSHSGFYVHIHISFFKGIPRNSNRNIIAIRQNNQTPKFTPEFRTLFKIHLVMSENVVVMNIAGNCQKKSLQVYRHQCQCSCFSTIPGCSWHQGEWLWGGIFCSFSPNSPTSNHCHTGSVLWQTTKHLIKCKGFILLINAVSCRHFFSWNCPIFFKKKWKQACQLWFIAVPPSFTPVSDNIKQLIHWRHLYQITEVSLGVTPWIDAHPAAGQSPRCHSCSQSTRPVLAQCHPLAQTPSPVWNSQTGFAAGFWCQLCWACPPGQQSCYTPKPQ